LYLDLLPPSCSCTSGKGKRLAKEKDLTKLAKELKTRKAI